MMTANIMSSLLGVAFAVAATVILRPTSIVTFLFIVAWIAAPFLGVLALNIVGKGKIKMGIGIHLSLVIGIGAFIDIVYLHPDPQGGIAFLMLPIILAAIIGASIAISNVKNKEK